MTNYSWEIPKRKINLELIHTLSESRAFRNESSLDDLSYDEVSGLFYLYCVSLVLLSLENEREAKNYARRTSAFNNFDKFRVSINDLYLLAFILLGNAKNYKHQDDVVNKSRLSELDFKRFLAMIASNSSGLDFMENYFYGLERQTRMTNGRYRIIRRNVMQWNNIDDKKKKSIIEDLIREMSKITLRAEMVDLIKDIK